MFILEYLEFQGRKALHHISRSNISSAEPVAAGEDPRRQPDPKRRVVEVPWTASEEKERVMGDKLIRKSVVCIEKSSAVKQ